MAQSPDSSAKMTATPQPVATGRGGMSMCMFQAASAAMKGVDATAVLILAETIQDWKPVRDSSANTIVASMSERVLDSARVAGLSIIELEPLENSIADRISLSLIEAVSMDLVGSSDRVVVIYSGFEAGVLDSMSVVRLGEHLEKLKPRELRELETSVPFETLKCVVDVATEIGREGREGKPVGTLIVVGDHRNVLERTRALGFDPFKGYPRRERNIRDSRVREAIKEIAQLDGAIIVSRDGTVEAGCRLIDAPVQGLSLPKGLGTRHWAAAAITAVTKAVAIVVSQSTGTVRLFRDGEVILRVSPMRRARAMKWADQETEPPGPGSKTE
ncbi:MAG: DNA integrity scanning protein DisA nucleotide-binding domain protein [Planctomycetota bacterium]